MIEVIQLTAVQRAHVLHRLLRGRAVVGVPVILDLEDGVGDPAEPASIPALREAARRNLLEWSRLSGDDEFGVRVNAPGSADFAKDLSLLRAMVDSGRTPSMIMLPKVESAVALDQSFVHLRSLGLGTFRLLPILESRRALAAAGEIAEAATRLGVSDMVYGHYDYCLDAGQFPFPEFDDPVYWDWLQPLISIVEQTGLRFVHPPSLRLRDRYRVLELRRRLAGQCRQPCVILAVSFEQARWLSEPEAGPPAPADGASLDRSRPDPHREAELVIRLYQERRRDPVAFAVHPAAGRFVPPHEFLAARRYLGLE